MMNSNNQLPQDLLYKHYQLAYQQQQQQPSKTFPPACKISIFKSSIAQEQVLFIPSRVGIPSTNGSQQQYGSEISAMDYMTEKMNTISTIKCPDCGCPVPQEERNETNKCYKCLQAVIDLYKYIDTPVDIYQCRQCERFKRPPWTSAPLQSQQLLHICLKKIKGLNVLKLLDAQFIYTQPHSKRIKLKISVEKQILGDAKVQQTLVVEFIVRNQQCLDCKKVFTPHTWQAQVQIRQKVPHKRTFLYLQQIILANNYHEKCINIKQRNEGIDFYFKSKSDANRFQDNIMKQVPCTSSQSKKQISHDEQNNDYNYKFSISIDICPICKDDLVCVPVKLSRKLGGTYPLLLCIKVTSMLHLLDIKSMRTYQIDYNTANTYQLKPLCSKQHLSEFVVLNVDENQSRGDQFLENKSFSMSSRKLVLKQKLSFVNVDIIRSNDFGKTNDIVNIETHLGSTVRINGNVLGYDLERLVLNCKQIDQDWYNFDLSSVVIVKKSYPKNKKKKRRAPRYWKLRRMDMEIDDENNNNKKASKKKGKKEKINQNQQENEYEQFLNDIQQDPQLQQNVKVYRNEDVIQNMIKQFERLKIDQAATSSQTQEQQKKQGSSSIYKMVKVDGKIRKTVQLSKGGVKDTQIENQKLKKQKQAIKYALEQQKQAEEELPIIQLQHLIQEMTLQTKEDLDDKTQD